MYRATAAAQKGLQEAVQRAEAAERSASQAQEQLEENGRRHAAASASLEVRMSQWICCCIVLAHIEGTLGAPL